MIEELENRTLMSADVTAHLRSGVLRINGTAQSSAITVDQSGGTVSVTERVVTHTYGPDQTTSSGLIIEGGSVSLKTTTIGTFSANRIHEIDLYAHAGDKTITVNPSVMVPRVQVDAGSGNDTLNLIAGRDKLINATGHDTVHVTLQPSRYLNQGAPYALIGANVQYNGTLKDDTFTVQLDLGSFAAGILQPAIDEVKSAVRFFQPLVDTLNSDVPVISDLSQQVGGQAYTWLDVIHDFGGSNARQAVDDFLKFYQSAQALSHYHFNGSVNLGTFTASSNMDVQTVQQENPLSQITGRALPFLAQEGFHFNLLEQPAEVMPLLFGRSVPLLSYDGFHFDAQTDPLGQTFDIPTPIPGVNVAVGYSGNIAVHGGLSLALDSSGLYDHNLLKGFAISNAYAELDPSVSVHGGIDVGIPDGFSIGGIGVQGTLQGSLRAQLPGTFYPGQSNGSILDAIQYSGGLSVSGSGYLQYSQSISDLASGDIFGAIGSIVTNQQHTDTLFTIPARQIANFG
jgi:hypothetical protein